ncbi:hypothetical protein GGI13_007744, partial [Coemansia sp. RSA 455]
QLQLQQPGSGASPATVETSAPLRASPAAPSEQSTPLLQPTAQMPGGGIPASAPQQQAATGSPNVGMTPAQAQAMLSAQQAMQVKQMQIQQQLMLQQQTPGGVNQPQFAQYLSSLFPHQLAQISNQQRMNLLAMRQQHQQQQQHQTLPQQQQFQGQLNGQNLLNQQAALQALQQGLLGGNGVGGMNGLAGLNPAVSQQIMAAQHAQNLKNQQLLKAGQPLNQTQQQQQQQQRPQAQANVNQMQLMRIRQAMQQQQQQQQQAMSGGPQRMFSIPGSQTATSPVLMGLPGPTSLPSSQQPIPGSPAMSTPLLNGSAAGHGFQMSPPMQAQPTPSMAGQQQLGMSAPHQASMSPTMHQQQVMMSPQMHVQPRPPLGHLPVQAQGQRPGMQPSQHEMMLNAATAAGLSPSAAQALIAQIAASAEANQQQQQQQQQQPAMSSSSHLSPPLPPASGEPSVSPSHAQARSVTGTPGQGSISPGSNGGSMTPISTPSAQTLQSTDSMVGQPTVAMQQRPPGNMPLAQGKQQQQPHVRPNRPVRPGARPHMARPVPPHQSRGAAGTTPPG